MLEITNLSLNYGKHLALDSVSLTVAKGECVVILGANGAGKSSLLKAVGGLVPWPMAAVRRMNGQNISKLAPHLLVDTGIGLVPEGRGNFAELTVRENLLLGAYPKRGRAREKEMLDLVLSLFPRIEERLSQQVRTMSGGEQQMVAIGRVLMSAPDILLLDEPSLGLSPLMTKELFRALVQVRETGTGILLVEQNALRSLEISDRGFLLETGRVVGAGTAEELRNDPNVSRAYLGA
ncbi:MULTISPECIES: ABC transporter ATP-binding protein [Hyphomicrobiales]|uniref:Branched-chain amino acid transport system ATP-binding protein n=2 Tax=Hyphomicrobiales TaxID=356 RepID=A0A285V2Y0_9HYPH|nr:MULTISPECIES: ABC transporter ATP-binding protein [Hyphomicrobiales]KAB0564642.1 ABC transporter ATP-binding protein [Brucella pituitosa]SOC48383.1 branched-chain amino acid transport system ATP-binding protein [Rhizobium subbaraonis]